MICSGIELPAKFTHICNSSCRHRDGRYIELFGLEISEAFVTNIIVGQLAEHISGMGAPESDTACPRRNISHRNLFPFADMIAQMDQVSMPICTDEKLFFTDSCHGNIRVHISVGIQHQRERHRTWSFRYLIGCETLK